MLRNTGKGLKKTVLKKQSEKKKEVKKDLNLVEKDREFYMNIWNKRKRKCEVCGVPFFTEEPRTYNFDHLLEKSKYPHLRHEEKNIALVCFFCHGKKTDGHPDERHIELINKAYKELVDGSKKI